MAGERAAKAGRRLTQPDELELMLPQCEKGIGQIITSPTSPDLIEGVLVAPLTVHPDDRGYFLELQRIGRGLAGRFPAATTQVSAALNYPGAIKAFHYHLHQTDCWNPVRGLLQVALADLRTGSSTFGRRNTLYIGPLRPWQVLVPPGVASTRPTVARAPSRACASPGICAIVAPAATMGSRRSDMSVVPAWFP